MLEVLPDSERQEIIDRQMLPRFRTGDFSAGTLAGLKAIIRITAPEIDSHGKLTYRAPGLRIVLDNSTQ